MNWNGFSERDAWRRIVAAAPPAWVLDHVRAVAGLSAAAADLARGRGLEVRDAVVVPGALLHDIGRSVTQDIHHATLGARMLRDDAWPEPIVRVVERHTGGGIDADEATALGLPPGDYTPRAISERIVAAADNLYSGDRRLRLGDVAAKYAAKGLPRAWQKIDALHADVSTLIGRDLQEVEPVTLDLDADG